ncbi:hypothetical protein BsWGS_24685 [Bradybaena similaris]
MPETRMDTYFRKRLQRRFYYGDKSSLEMPSLPLTELAVGYFHDSVPEKLGHVDMFSASNLIRRNHVSPCSMVLSLLYAKRLRQQQQQQKHLLRAMSSADVFFISMMMASKYLYDEGVDEEVFNDEWADNMDQDIDDVNQMETDFLQAMEWRLFVQAREFEDTLTAIERRLALQEGYKRGWFTYTELDVLMNSDLLWMLWENIGSECSKLLTAMSAAYVTSVLSMIGSTSLAMNISGQLSSITLAILTLHSSALTSTVHQELSAHISELSSPHFMWMSPSVRFVSPQENNDTEIDRSLVWGADVYTRQNTQWDSHYRSGVDGHGNGSGEAIDYYDREENSPASCKSSFCILLSQVRAAICLAWSSPGEAADGESSHGISVGQMLQRQRSNHKQTHVHEVNRRMSRLSDGMSHNVDMQILETRQPFQSRQKTSHSYVCLCSSHWIKANSAELDSCAKAEVHCQAADLQTRLLPDVAHRPDSCIFAVCVRGEHYCSHPSCMRVMIHCQRNPDNTRQTCQSVLAAEPLKDGSVDDQHQMGLPIGFVTSVYQSVMIT